MKAEFEKGLEKVETLTFPLETGGKAKKGVPEDDNLPSETAPTRESIGPSPEATIFEAWRKIEGEMQALLGLMHDNDSNQPLSSRYRADEVARLVGLTDVEAISLRTLQKLRDSVAQSGETLLSWDEAIRFSQAVERLLASMRRRRKLTK